MIIPELYFPFLYLFVLILTFQFTLCLRGLIMHHHVWRGGSGDVADLERVEADAARRAAHPNVLHAPHISLRRLP